MIILNAFNENIVVIIKAFHLNRNKKVKWKK